MFNSIEFMKDGSVAAVNHPWMISEYCALWLSHIAPGIGKDCLLLLVNNKIYEVKRNRSLGMLTFSRLRRLNTDGYKQAVKLHWLFKEFSYLPSLDSTVILSRYEKGPSYVLHMISDVRFAENPWSSQAA